MGTVIQVVSATAPASCTSTRTLDPAGCSGDSPTHMTICAVLSGEELTVDDVGTDGVVTAASGAGGELEQAPSTSKQPSRADRYLSRVMITD